MEEPIVMPTTRAVACGNPIALCSSVELLYPIIPGVIKFLMLLK